jgi:hypothetical protein
MESVSLFHHRFVGCQCGHSEHTGYGLHAVAAVLCLTCAAMEQHEAVVFAFEPIARLEEIGVGGVVKHNGVPLKIVDMNEVTRLGGSYHTGFVRIKLAVPAM